MQPPPTPEDDAERLVDLHALGLLDADQNPLFDAITRLCRSLFGTPIALVSLVDESRQWFASRIGLEPPETPREVAFCAHAIVDDEVLVVEDASADERFAQNPLVTGDPNIAFYAGAPVHSPRGHRLGTVCVIDTDPRGFTEQERQDLADLALIVDRIIADQTAGITDPLTGVHNRRGFQLGLEQATALSDRDVTTVTVAYADVDGMKQLNDRDGHGAGDAVLRAAARALRDGSRRSDVVGRLGGDEFGVIFIGATAPEVDEAVRRIGGAFEEHVAGRAGVGLSVAAVTHEPGEHPAALLARADRAMYEVKGRRRR